MKKIWYIFIVIFVIICGGIITTFCILSLKIENLDGYIVDLESYSNIGVAVVNKNSKESKNMNIKINSGYCSISSNNSNNESLIKNKRNCLVGVDNEGNVEELRFKKKNSNIKPKLNICSFNQTKRYIIVTYFDGKASLVSYSNQFKNGKEYDRNYRTYIIDKQTNLVFKFDLFEDIYIGQGGYGIIGSDCGDYFIIRASLSDGKGHYIGTTYCKVGVENDQLKVQEIFRKDTLPGGSEIRLCDIYGNCIIHRYSNQRYYVLKNTGELSLLDINLDLCGGINHPGTTYRAIDGCIYNANQVLNYNGEFVDAEYITDGYILPTETLAYSTESADYYYAIKTYNNGYFWYYPNTVIKVEKNSERYNFEEIPFNINGEGFQYKENYYSFGDDNVIMKTNILTGDQVIINLQENIILNSISLFNYSHIYFVGINEYMQTVKGIIMEDGRIIYKIEEPNFVTYYLQPLISRNKERQ